MKWILKGLAWLSLTVLFILILIILCVRIPYLQNRIVKQVLSVLETRIDTRVSLKSIYLAFPKKIVLHDLYLEDQHADTLLFAGTIEVDTDLWKLFSQRVGFNYIQIDNAVLNIKRAERDSSFNFDYIIDSFAGDDLDTTKTAWTFVPGDVNLTHTSIRFHDLFGGNVLDATLGALDLKLSELDLIKSIYKFSYFELLDSRLSLRMYSDRMDTTTSNQDISTPVSIDFDIDEAHLNNVSLHYFNIVNDQKIDIELGDLSVQTDKVDLKNRNVELEKLQIDNSYISYQVREDSISPSRPSGNILLDLDFGWQVQLKELKLYNDSFQYDVLNLPLTRQGIDFNHLSILNLNTSVHDIELRDKRIGAFIDNLSFSERNGFSLQSLTSKFWLTDTSLTMENLRAETLTSSLDLNMVADFGSLSQGDFSYEKARFKLNTHDSFIALHDILFFAPSMLDSSSIQLPDEMMLSVAADLKGSFDDLQIDHLKLKTLDSTLVILTGNIKGLSEWREALINVKLDQLLTTSQDMKLILPDSLIPSAVMLPDWISLEGNFKGTMNKAEFVADLESDFGKMDAEIHYDLSSVKSYDVKMSADNFNVGALMAQEKLGAITIDAEINGSGITKESLDATIKASVSELRFNQYDYKDFEIGGSVKNSILNGIASPGR